MQENINSEDELYYVPEPEEFHAGLELEFRIEPKLTGNEEFWTKTKIALNSEIHIFLWVKSMSFRVKRLDVLDLEGIDKNYVEQYPWKVYKYKHIYIAFRTEKTDNNIIISYDPECVNNIVFRGYIKNITKLKGILKMTNIDV